MIKIKILKLSYICLITVINADILVDICRYFGQYSSFLGNNVTTTNMADTNIQVAVTNTSVPAKYIG